MRGLAAGLVLTLAGGLGPAPLAAAEDAIASVVRIYSTTVQTGASPDLLADKLAPSVDLETLASKVLGKAYNDAPEAERADFREVLLDVIAHELARRLGGDQQLTIFRTRTLGGGDVVVFSRLARSDGSEKLIDWKMRPCGQAYCVYDLRGDNVSFSVARRDDYAARLQSAGGSLAELTRALRAEVAARQ